MKGVKYRLYNEETTYAQMAVYNETAIKIHKLIEKYSFNIYHLKTSPKTTLKVKFSDNDNVDCDDENVKKIRNLQVEDLFYLYKNICYEVFYSVTHLDKNNYYSYEMLILTKKSFDINKIVNYDFNLINIISCNKKDKSDINFSFIESFFENRTKIKDGNIDPEKIKDIFKNCRLSKDEFIKNYNNNNPVYEHGAYLNANSFKSEKHFNQDLYSKNNFRRLNSYILDFGRVHFIEYNEFGKGIFYDDLYESVGLFFTNFNDLAGLKVLDVTGTTVKYNELEHYPSTVYENLYDMSIRSDSFSKEFVIFGFINFENKEIRFCDKQCSSCIVDIKI